MTILALIGAKGLYLLFAWLLSAAIGAWMSERKGYGERVGLACGLLLTVVGLLCSWCCCPGAPARCGRQRGRCRDASAAELRRAARLLTPAWGRR